MSDTTTLFTIGGCFRKYPTRWVRMEAEALHDLHEHRAALQGERNRLRQLILDTHNAFSGWQKPGCCCPRCAVLERIKKEVDGE